MTTPPNPSARELLESVSLGACDGIPCRCRKEFERDLKQLATIIDEARALASDVVSDLTRPEQPQPLPPWKADLLRRHRALLARIDGGRHE